jgi:tRNA pseudouridine synthase 10
LKGERVGGLQSAGFPVRWHWGRPMSKDENNEEEDWSKFASAGYESAYDPWADLVPQEESEEFLDDDIDFEDFSSIRPPPAEEGLDYLVKMGTCNHCMARLSGKSFNWESAEEVGISIRISCEERGVMKDDDIEYCPYCEDLFVDLDILVEVMKNELDGVEFKKMQLGAHFAKDHVAKEDDLRTRHGATGSQALKAAFNDALGFKFSKEMGEIELVKDQPEVMVLIDTLTFDVTADLRSLYLYGRYRKLERGIPQTRWPCRVCKGRDGGCETCNETGLQYPTSVQDQIGEPLRAAFQAKNTAFHGMGREDIDVRCLGRGRPFVIEMKSPIRRYADLSELTELVNATSAGRVEISELRASRRSEVARIKGTAAEKSYTIRFKYGPEQHCPPVKIDGEEESQSEDVAEVVQENPPEWTAEQVTELCMSLEGVTLAQQTPQRVAHRRADKVRERQVVSISDIVVEGDEVEMTVRCESGTYVKELVHSDEGRTVPSVAEKLGLVCEVTWLDVNDVHAD